MGVFGNIFNDQLSNVSAASIDNLQRSSSIQSAFERSTRSGKDPVRDSFINSNTSYSGTDCTAIVQIQDKLISLGNVATFSYSIFREKEPVRVLGRSYAKGYTGGGRTIAGSLVFVVFDRSPLYEIITHLNYVRNPEDRYTTPLPDQIPPLDFMLLFSNEYGHMSILRIYALEFVQEGQVHSINDIYTENTMQYVARDIDILINNEQVQDFKDMLFNRQIRGLFVDNQLGTMLEYKQLVEKNIAKVNKYISNIDTEYGRRSVAGIFTLGTSEALAYGVSKLPGVDVATREDLRKQKSKYLRLKEKYLVELEDVDRQIELYQQRIKGWNAQSKGEGVSGNDELRTSRPVIS